MQNVKIKWYFDQSILCKNASGDHRLFPIFRTMCFEINQLIDRINLHGSMMQTKVNSVTIDDVHQGFCDHIYTKNHSSRSGKGNQSLIQQPFFTKIDRKSVV